MQTIMSASELSIRNSVYFRSRREDVIAKNQPRILITGGSGFVGRNLTLKLVASGYFVIVIDVVTLPSALRFNPSVEYYNCDVSDHSRLSNVVQCARPDLIVHLVSYGMSGAAMLSTKCYEINVKCLGFLLQLCLEQNIAHFIYTSTYNTVCGGNRVVNGSETMPYFPLQQHVDQYSRTKALAEQMCMQHNGNKLANGGSFKTAVIRPAAIYGVGEERFLPRVVKYIDRGVCFFTIGDGMVDWVHVDNLVSLSLLH